ncbi:hypothetical protein [Kitasatospora sp. NBC_01302]|uniref:hypothetical protein n=1 Tax=Kitasatospora sp. NBC_01302 TaxID=2903575 RepID=UPI002E139002|nr:hypothetical protein OG294_14500 [Kitasatospora sp. NBC_01302]
MAEITTAPGRCIGCGTQKAPHLGELQTTRVADGVVRDERVRRCTDCQIASTSRYQPEQLSSGYWALRDRQHGVLVVDHVDSAPRLYPSRAAAQADLAELVARGAL